MTEVLGVMKSQGKVNANMWTKFDLFGMISNSQAVNVPWGQTSKWYFLALSTYSPIRESSRFHISPPEQGDTIERKLKKK